MFIEYNGINLEVIHTRGITREVVMNQARTQNLYTRWTLDVVAYWNPQIVSYRVGTPPTRVKGELPAETDSALRHRLAQPRKKLKYWSGSKIVLETPAGSFTTDANNGPVVERVDVLQVHGIKTWVVEFKVTACVQECASVPTVLSHTFRTYSDADQDYFTTLITEGEAVFNTAKMVEGGLEPDDFRIEFHHPVPDDCQREKIEVIPDEAGTMVKYRFIDRERAFCLGKFADANRVEAYQTFWWSKTSFAAAAGRHALGSAPGAIGAIIAAPHGAPSTAGTFAFGTVWSGMVGSCPQYYHHMLVRAWGNKLQNRWDMTRLALGLAFGRIGGIGSAAETELIISHELSGKFAEVNLTHRFGMEGGLGGAAAVGRDWGLHVVAAFKDVESIEERPAVLVDPAPAALGISPTRLFSKNPLGNPAPPRLAGKRGSILVRLVHQALHDACSTPPRVAAIDRVNVERTW